MKYLTPSVQSYCLCLAMIVYGVFSSPTPDTIGLPEIVVAILLSLSFRLIFESNTIFSWAVLGYGLSIPTLVAMINGNVPSDIIRDIVPFFYLMMSIFLGWVALTYPQRFLICLAGIGIMFSVRTIFAYQQILLTPALWGQGPPADLLYLANSPEVLFSALYCIAEGGRNMMRGDRWLKGILIAMLSILPIIAMALMTQRAGVGAVMIYILIAVCLITYHRPKWGMIFGLLLLAAGVVVWPVFEPVLFLLRQKTEIVGLNARTQEWSAVLTILSDGWGNLLFGEGWGGRIENPAVGGLNVNYTHSLVSSLLLKTGLVGAVAILTACLWPVFRALKGQLAQKPRFDLAILGAALFPLLISVFLYASYKSLGFGLILLVFFIFPIRKLEKNTQSVR
ncbi:MAG: hypothetical protein A3B66_03720 [Alphaproteobacteria bacterium RIFCSPHIGHO2_02_FULL_46_13]|nr:MAG: hypothetical protein A3B66_03720 [Alphaproteobacteria bacterium RIFCSPHIGHO2_02_FULL_46_13]